jgi:hypothetical protein
MLHVLLSQAGSYADVVEYLKARGARVTDIGMPARPGVAFHGKSTILKAMLSPSLLRTRKLWTREDRVLVIGWQALPVLAAIRCGLLPRPTKILVMACFVHGMRARRIIDRVWRLLKFPGLGFITFSQGEARNLVDNVGMAPQDVHFHLWRQDLYGRADPSMIIDDGSVFAGGYSNRDYDLLLRALESVPAPLTIVAAERNEINLALRPATTVLRDLAEADFEALLAKSRVVAMPLRSQGEACGQSVLLRVLRNGKPMIATRHESIEAYLGKDYPGFVEHDSVQAMRDGLTRALQDESYRATLSDAIRRASALLERQDGPGKEIEQFLQA